MMHRKIESEDRWGARALFMLALAAMACQSQGQDSKTRLPPDLPVETPEISDRYLIEIDQERVRLTKSYLSRHHPELAASLPDEDEVDSITFKPLSRARGPRAPSPQLVPRANRFL